MRKVLLLFLLVPGMVYAQVVYEDFESGLTGDWLLTSGERWEADSIFALNGKYSLHHSFDNNDSGCDRIGIRITGLQPALSDTEWRFMMKHAYNPSSSNNWSFFLMSDEPPPAMGTGGTISGFALGVNLSGYNDTLCLWKINSGRTSIVLSTSINWQNDIGIDSVAALTVTRSVDGLWQVFIEGEQKQNLLIGEESDSDLFNVAWAGIMYEYSSSQDCKLWIDDVIINGHIEIDNQPPVVDTVYFSGNNTIILQFNEALSETPSEQSFLLKPGDFIPDEITQFGESYLLEFGQELTNKIYYDLSIGDVCDARGNCSDTIVNNILLALPERSDIIVSEIMFDPEPPADLPPAEYIELYNTSGFDFNTSRMQMDIGGDIYWFPEAQFKAGDFMLFTNSGDVNLFTSYGKVLCPDSKFSLNNNTDMVLLRDSEGEVIHGLEYDIGWYSNQLKQYGGWALEMIDYGYPFAGSPNWTESRNRSGGTPGSINSVNSFNPDLEAPLITNIFPVSSRHVSLSFSETIDMKATDDVSWAVDGNAIININITDPLTREIDIELEDSLVKGIIYRVSPEVELNDMAGNGLLIPDGRFGIPSLTENQDILFSEIMFDPLPGGAEFIEIYNNSEKIADLSDHFIVSYNSATSDTGKINWLSDDKRCLMPGDYYVITTDREAVVNNYNSCNKDRIFEQGSFPSLPDKEGNLLLYNRNLILIDRMYYSDEMHSAMLSVTSGISLERIDLDAESTDRMNWKSAAGTSGYATPGLKNSAAEEYEDIESNGIVRLSSRKISPDNDGFEDYLRILVSSASDQNILSVQVFNDMGYPVRKLADKLTSGYSSLIIWDGCDDYGQLVREGIYIICSTIMPAKGPPEIVKKVVAVVYY